jgi:uncharacterized membrane protein YbaN (DUF454 family)
VVIRALKTILLTGFGFIFLGLGAIGLFAARMADYPFVLVSLRAFPRAPRIKARIMRISFSGSISTLCAQKTAFREKRSG